MRNGNTGRGGGVNTRIAILGWFVVLLWVLELIDVILLHQGLNGYGIRPRTVAGLRGILLAPFFHGSLEHLATNTLPFIVLGWLVMVPNVRDFFIVTAVTIVVSGAGVWLVGATGSVHIGASGLVFGYLGFLLFRGYFERSFQAVLIAVIVGFFYGSLIWGVLPSGPGISWEAHLFGFLGGAISARFLAQRKRRRAL